MSLESVGYIGSPWFPDCPIKLKKAVDDCSNPNDLLDCLLKLLGDASNEPLYVPIIGVIPQLCTESVIQPAEIEFAILSLQNIYCTNIFKTLDVKCQLLQVVISVLLCRELSAEAVENVVTFLLNILDDENSPILIKLCSIDCLIELELSIPETLNQKIDHFIKFVVPENQLKNKACEAVSLILKSSNLTDANLSKTASAIEVLKQLLDLLPTLHPFAIALVSKNILDLNHEIGLQTEFRRCLERISERFRYTFDLHILKTISLFQDRIDETSYFDATVISSTHPALPVGRNLIALDWLASSNVKTIKHVGCEQFQPTYFDGADVRLKKMILLSNLSSQELTEPTLLCQHLEKLTTFGIKSATSRSFAAVFRVMRNMLANLFPSDVIQVVVCNTVELGSRHPACLPHVVDFLKHLGESKQDQYSKIISLKLVDAFDEVDVRIISPYLEQLVEFFTESTTFPYEFCQPRLVLRVLRNCVLDRITKKFSCGVVLLELCQTLIRNQDYEIFQPELKAVLSLVESSHEDSDVRQRAWMLRSLITHVNTDSLKDAFDVDMELSLTGKILSTEVPLISIKVLSDCNLTDSNKVKWCLERKRSPRSFYFPLEISLTDDDKSLHRKYYGIRIDFVLDPNWGRAESLYIPVLQDNQVRKECLQLQPATCSSIEIQARAVMNTTDGLVFISALEPVSLKLEELLSPLSSNKTFSELWDQLTSHSQKSCSSVLQFTFPDKLFEAVQCGVLARFQMDQRKPTELALVTPDSFLILARILSVKNSWYTEILTEDPSVLPVIKSLLSEYTL